MSPGPAGDGRSIKPRRLAIGARRCFVGREKIAPKIRCVSMLRHHRVGPSSGSRGSNIGYPGILRRMNGGCLLSIVFDGFGAPRRSVLKAEMRRLEILIKPAWSIDLATSRRAMREV